MPRVLIVEDDDSMRDMVGYALADEGTEIEAVADGESALELFSSSGPFDLVILDVMLPGVDGITICKELTSVSDVPVIMLTACDDEMSVVVGLEVGADNYVTKPFRIRELVSRVRAHLRCQRRNTRAEQQKLEFPGLQMDLLKRLVFSGGEPVELTAKEFDVLALIASHPGRVYDREQIMRYLYEGSFYGDGRSADVHIQHLRKKIEPDPKNPRYIRTVRGLGYRF